MIQKPDGNVVLEFKEIDSFMGGKRTITLTATEEPDVFVMERGLTALNQIVEKKVVRGEAEVKGIWVDAVVNGFKMVKNELFMRGVKDVLNIAPGTKFSVQPPFEDTPPPHKETTIEIAVPDDDIQGGCAPQSGCVILNESNP